MDHIKLKKNITYGFAREVLLGYGIILDEERRAARMAHSNDHRAKLDAHFYEHDEQLANEDENAERDSTILNKSRISEMLTRDKSRDSKTGGKDKKKEKMTQFVEWNFQKRDKRRNKQEKLRKDHPSFNIVTRLLDRFKLGKDIKELMPIKSVARFIYNIYMAKAADLASDK